MLTQYRIFFHRLIISLEAWKLTDETESMEKPPASLECCKYLLMRIEIETFNFESLIATLLSNKNFDDN